MMIDLNVDLGEGGAHDAELTALASSVNIACGGHAGDEKSMLRAVGLARASGTAIGAHPSYEDREEFGRRHLDLTWEEIADSVAWQVEALARISPLHHVKPHGALYNQAQGDEEIARAVVEGISRVLPETLIYTLPGGELARVALEKGHRVWGEGFIDRGYQEDGRLIPRGEKGALIEDVEEAVAQAMRLAEREEIETLCVHGDGLRAVEILTKLRARELFG
jgi:UPF0271 protein